MDTKQVTVSVIIPVYNVEKYLEECLDSILCQSLENIEIICINDASIDNSLNILKRYEKVHEKICVVCHEKNKGLSAARNSGLKVARGEYIFFLDSDDMLAGSTVLEELYFMGKKENLDIVYYNYVKQYENKTRQIGIKEEGISRELHTGKSLFSHNCKKHRLDLAACRQFCRREFLLQHNLLFREGILHEDMIFSFLCAMMAGRVMETEKMCYVYRQRENSIMTIKDRRREQSMFVVMSEVYSYWISHEFTEEENEAIAYFFDALFGAYKCYKKYERESSELECGNSAEKHLYKLLKKEQKPLFSAQQLKRIVNTEQLIVYGAGMVAEEVVYNLKSQGVSIDYIAVSNKGNNPQSVLGVAVKEIKDLQELYRNALVIIAVTEKYVDEISLILQQLGFFNVLIL